MANNQLWIIRDSETQQEIHVDAESGVVLSPARPGEERDPDNILATIDPIPAARAEEVFGDTGYPGGFWYKGTWYVTELVKIEDLDEWKERRGVTPIPPAERPRTGLRMWPPSVFYETINRIDAVLDAGDDEESQDLPPDDGIEV